MSIGAQVTRHNWRKNVKTNSRVDKRGTLGAPIRWTIAGIYGVMHLIDSREASNKRRASSIGVIEESVFWNISAIAVANRWEERLPICMRESHGSQNISYRRDLVICHTA